MSGFAITRWWIIRHAPVDNPGGVIYGRTDLPAVFADNALLARIAATLPTDIVRVASNLSRSIETLKRLDGLRDVGDECARASGGTGLAAVPDIQIIPALAEQDFGAWEGLRWADIPARQVEIFWDDYANAVPPDGESFSQLAVRAGTAFKSLTTEHAGRNIVAVLHGGTIRAILASILDIPPAAALTFDVAPLGMTRIDYLEAPDNPGWRIGSVNLTL